MAVELVTNQHGTFPRNPSFCSVDGCDKSVSARGWCTAHYTRWKRHGDPLAGRASYPPGSRCSVASCDEPRRHRDWCGKHYAMWTRTGDPMSLPSWTPAPAGGVCVVCGSPDLMPKSRRYCSSRCAQLVSRRKRGETVLDVAVCVGCGDEFDISPKPGERKRSSASEHCDRCEPLRNHRSPDGSGVASVALLRSLGDTCGICGESVDLTIRKPNPLSPSIDHIVAKRAGGSADRANLQIAHLGCNQQKNSGYVERTNQSLYHSRAWRRWSLQIRADEPLCACGAPTVRIVVIHAAIDGGDPWDRDNVRACCLSCANGKVARDYQARAALCQ